MDDGGIPRDWKAPINCYLCNKNIIVDQVTVVYEENHKLSLCNNCFNESFPDFKERLDSIKNKIIDPVILYSGCSSCKNSKNDFCTKRKVSINGINHCSDYRRKIPNKD